MKAGFLELAKRSVNDRAVARKLALVELCGFLIGLDVGAPAIFHRAAFHRVAAGHVLRLRHRGLVFHRLA